ncbi:MAG: DUF1573 domain-containing protein [Pirellulaceae bacterium]|jgi:hypothetical protein|nr:DUF1573 domain-containing protein [Thermoguttaceae bacterium]MDI9444996.1 DUF1573 domain-containing protein [Planctomycetota bacterium]NLZ00098.1 DUF1573 domain-containing protein [Pirellulaceae bacterium]
MKAGTMIAMAILVVVLPAEAFGQKWAVDMFESTSHDFGCVARGAKAEYEFVLKNPFMDDVQISGAYASCGCTSVEVTKPALKTYESGSILARLNTDRFVGQRGATITVHFNRPQRATVRLKVSGTIHNDLVVSPSSADLGTVEEGVGAERRISVRYAGARELQIVDVKSANPHVSARIMPSAGVHQASCEVVVQLDEKAPPGYLKDNLLLVTTNQQLRQIPVMVEARILPEVTVTPDALFLGVLKPGQKVTRNVVVRGNKPFLIQSITADRDGIEFDTAGAGTPRPIHLVPVTITADAAPGAMVHRATIRTDLSSRGPELNSYAVVEP